MVLLKYSDKETSSKMIFKGRGDSLDRERRPVGISRLSAAVVLQKRCICVNLKRLKDQYKIYSVMSRTVQ